MPLYCTKCGAANEEFAEFCKSCGDNLIEAREKNTDKNDEPAQTSEKKLYRSRSNKMITGLAAGLAKYFDMEVDLMRILWVIAFFVSGSTIAIVYLIMAAVIPLEPE
ncbi:MAG: PspC domain-containing protein [Candidatus Heimdallarchaeota archaeon]|nr:PspC domain-containing protein [Candidatus Heimdallarchaeota archaeon]